MSLDRDWCSTAADNAVLAHWQSHTGPRLVFNCGRQADAMGCGASKKVEDSVETPGMELCGAMRLFTCADVTRQSHSEIEWCRRFQFVDCIS